MSWYEPDDDDLGERAGEAGYIDPDTADVLRALLKQIEYPDPFPRPGSRSDAALVLIDNILNPVNQTIVPTATFFRADPPEDPHVLWARTLLKDVLS